MMLSVNRFMSNMLSMPDFLAVCEEIGAEGVGLQLPEALDSKSLAMLEQSNLVPTSVSGFLNCLDFSQGGARLREGAYEALAIARDLGVPLIVTLGAVRRDATLTVWRRRLSDSLKLLTETAEAFGTQIAIEPLAVTDAAWSAVIGLGEVDEILSYFPAVTVVPDFWHIWADQQLGRIFRAHGSKFPVVHVADVDPENPRERIAPGDGVAELTRQLRILQDSGFAGWTELEVIPATNSTEDPRMHLSRTFQGLRSVTGKAQR